MRKIDLLKKKANWVRREMLKIHALAPETRVASSLSCVEILVALYYGEILNYNPQDLSDSQRDRFIISKAHGVVSLYPILADLGFFDEIEITKVCQSGAKLPGIPDMMTPGLETINGSLGHGLGVACGIALALKRQNKSQKVFVLIGDGELYEGSVWEAIMFAGEHKLDNLVAIIDNNKVCMLDFCKNIINMEPLDQKFIAFNWQAERIDGHDVEKVYNRLSQMKNETDKPKMLIADTIKGKGVPSLETDSLSHIRILSPEQVAQALKALPL